MNRFVLYGIAGMDDGYRVVRYSFVDGYIQSMKWIKAQAGLMRCHYPSIEHVYMVDADYEWYREYRKLIKLNTPEAYVIFRDALESEGVMVI